MLSKLSLRNARRAFGEYALFFVTLSCCVSAIYAFNSLIFSDTVKALPDLEILPWLIIASSLLVILIMGWIIGYMISYMLRKRSREFSIYMICGIQARRIAALLLRENVLIGILAFVAGILPGMLLSQILEAALLRLFGMPFCLHVPFFLPALGLTLVYFWGMLLYGMRKSIRWIRRVQPCELLRQDQSNEKPPVSDSGRAVTLLFLSLLSCLAGFGFIWIQPLGKGYDVLAGTGLLVLFLSGFFRSVPAALTSRLGSRAHWKYKKHRLVTFRDFTARIHSMSSIMGILSILFMLSITLAATGTAIGMMVTRSTQADVFDIMILRHGETGDFSRYAQMIREDFSGQDSYSQDLSSQDLSSQDLSPRDHSYGIYASGKTDFLTVRNQAVVETGRRLNRPYAEFRQDTCMLQSDYLKLRKLLGYRDLSLDPALCYVHCVPALERGIRTLTRERNDLECAGYPFAREGVFTEPFSQNNGYGNGMDYILIVPDGAVKSLRLLYGVYAAVTDRPLSPDDLGRITASCEGLVLLDGKRARSGPDGAPTRFVYEDMDYLSGKWVSKAELHYLYSIIICLFYLSLILVITGAAILATQVLGDWQKKQRQNRILSQLGMSGDLISRLVTRQLALLFLLPLLPAVLVSICFTFICTKKILVSFFQLPIVTDLVWMGQSLMTALVLFSVLYGIYFAAARICCENSLKNTSGNSILFYEVR